MKNNILREVLRLSRSKLLRHREYGHWIHWSYIIQRNTILDAGTNNSHIPPIHLGYSSRLGWNGDAKTHSEFSAWKAAKGLIDKNWPWEIVNLRLNKSGEMRNSCPCQCCNAFLHEMGCSQAWFTTDIGWARMNIGA